MVNRKERIVWIDIAKGISIILVALGHMGIVNIPFFGEWLSSFRMPFFFFVSGILFSTKNDISLFLKKRIRSLIRPYIIFSFIVLFYYYFEGIYTYNDIIDRILNGWGGYALWFIPVLFFTQLCWYIIKKNMNANRSLAIILLSGVAGIISSLCIGYIRYNILLVLTSVLYFGLGNLLKCKLVEEFKNKSSEYLIKYLFTSFMLSLSYVLNFTRIIDYSSNQLGYGVPSIISGISGALFICITVNLIIKNIKVETNLLCNILVFAGKNSYIILAFHQLLLSYCTLHMRTIIENYYIYKLIEFVIVGFCCYILIFIINNYMPWVIGKEKEKRV